jgi:hypothetical protein
MTLWWVKDRPELPQASGQEPPRHPGRRPQIPGLDWNEHSGSGHRIADLGTESLAASPSHIDSSPPSRSFGSYPAATREPTVGNSGCGRSSQSNLGHRRVSGLGRRRLSDVEVLARLP